MKKKKTEPQIPENAFTLDPETGSVPSITLLLNRKRLKNPKDKPASKKPAPPPAPALSPPPPRPLMEPETAPPPQEFPPITLEPVVQPVAQEDEKLLEPSVTLEPVNLDPLPTPEPLASEPLAGPQKEGPLFPLEELPPATSEPSVQTRQAQRRAPPAELAIWDLEVMRTSSDPLGQALAALIKKGVKSALFLAITSPPPGSPVPHFLASATVLPDSKLALWTGLKWDPTLTPETWNHFVKNGYVELAPPGTTTNMKSNRNIIRAAFGIKQEEWLLLVRAGTAQVCRGVLVLVSEKSIVNELGPHLPQLAAVPGAPAKKAA